MCFHHKYYYELEYFICFKNLSIEIFDNALYLLVITPTRAKKTKVKAPKTVKSRINQISERDAYYYIDDVSLIETSNYSQIDSIVNIKEILLDTSSKSTTLILKNILFESNEAILLPISYSELDIMAEYLNKYPQAKIEVSGYTDNTGREKQNKTLSEKRAKAVANYLITKSIDKDRKLIKALEVQDL